MDDLDLASDTIVVFTSDHGDMLGDHGLLTKGVATSYEAVHNIPRVIRVLGATDGEEEAHPLVILVDLAPISLELCGLPPLARVRGRSSVPVLAGEADAANRRHADAEFYGERFVCTQPIIRDGGWKCVFSPGGIDEFYDLAGDPHETGNLVGDPAYGKERDQRVEQM